MKDFLGKFEIRVVESESVFIFGRTVRKDSIDSITFLYFFKFNLIYSLILFV